jgi:hypothetical protein
MLEAIQTQIKAQANRIWWKVLVQENNIIGPKIRIELKILSSYLLTEWDLGLLILTDKIFLKNQEVQHGHGVEKIKMLIYKKICKIKK